MTQDDNLPEQNLELVETDSDTPVSTPQNGHIEVTKWLEEEQSYGEPIEHHADPLPAPTYDLNLDGVMGRLLIFSGGLFIGWAMASLFREYQDE